MKTKILVLFLALAIIALFARPPARAQTPTSATPAPIVVAPQPKTVQAPFTATLTAAQVSSLVAAIGTQGVTFAPGAKVQQIQIVMRPDGSALIRVSFVQP